MDAATLQQKIYSGYGKAALRIGPAYDLFRPTSAISPTAQPNQIATLNASFNSQDMTYSKPNVYGKPLWYALVDGTQTQVGDYLIGDGQTFFIAAMQTTLPILAVQCTNTLNIFRPQQQTAAGENPYGGTVDENQTELMTAWPASVLQGTKGEKDGAVLPGDVRLPWWAILLPAWPGVILRSADIITDDINRRFIISSAEITDLGWRITAMQAQT
ncbi:hypothetical protein SAMN05443245_5245 [Paraburkholderia fungorum]|uniref:Uncharacterized protein n=1 Tax=Paraburkholderia fungorum TaxID=134537 RepID=A0A1H1IJY0_9BURK|nr:hypothetical protein [Paraburkholderia fungorum]SDR37616.1 hypothetical protein SAMN05443245_5245 [Paraburkholderia fungorum]